MLKVFSAGWLFSKPQRQTAPDAQNVPSTFTVPGRDTSQLYQVSMKENAEDFVDIAYKKLSYAEVASLSKHKQQTSRVPLASPRAHRVHENQYEVLADDDDDLAESLYLAGDRLKVNNYFVKNKVYKEADKTRKQRRAPARKK